ncbi:MAG: hypothetical protein RL244_475 [Pseudomonadota bacterium]|jgi:putative PIN family toxin of toxin-antitoxin system
MQQAQGAQPIVIDTNIVLDLLLFEDPTIVPLREALQQGRLQWLATPRMREELARVLHYPQIAKRAVYHGRENEAVLAAMDARVQWMEPAPRCEVICKDADDQCFIDLALLHQALLLSKDGYVLRLRKRLARRGVTVARALPAHWCEPALSA